jgi:cyclohexadienyl dehydratase
MRRRAFLSLAALLPSTAKSWAADELVEFRKRGVLRVGTSGDYAPFSRTVEGRTTGLDIELATLLAGELGMRLELLPFRWPELAARMEKHDFDLVASGVTMRADRLFFGRFSRPYAVTGAVACVPKASAAKFKTLADLEQPGVRLSVNRGGHLERVAKSRFPRAAFDVVEKNENLFARVTAKAADAAISDSAEARFAAGPEFTALGPFTHDRKALYVSLDAAPLARFVDQWIFRHEEDSSLQKLRRKWLGSPDPVLFHPYLEAVAADVELRFQVMPSVAAAKRATGAPVEDRAQEGRVLERARDLAKGAALDPRSLEAVYAVLIKAAKIIQLAPVSGASPTVTLAALRDVIATIDEHLVACLKTAAPRVPPAEWQRGLLDGIQSEVLPKQVLTELAAALAGVRRVQGRG